MTAPAGTIGAVRGSVVDVRFGTALPAIRSLLRTGPQVAIAVEVLAQLDERTVRGIARTSTQELATDKGVGEPGPPLQAPVGPAILSRMFDVFGRPIDRL